MSDRYWDEPQYNDADDVEGPGDVTLPPTLHHMQAKAEVNALVKEGALGAAGADEAMRSWKARNELGEGDIAEAAIEVLEERDVIDEDEAGRLREKAA